MTSGDKIVTYYYWTRSGFGELAMPLALINFASIIVVMLTQKGITIPMWTIPIVAIVVGVVACTNGWFFQRYEIYSRMASLVNQKQNPEMKQVSDDVIKIKTEVNQISSDVTEMKKLLANWEYCRGPTILREDHGNDKNPGD